MAIYVGYIITVSHYQMTNYLHWIHYHCSSLLDGKSLEPTIQIAVADNNVAVTQIIGLPLTLYQTRHSGKVFDL